MYISTNVDSSRTVASRADFTTLRVDVVLSTKLTKHVYGQQLWATKTT